MNRNALEWYELLARGLVWAAGIVLLLGLIAAVVVAGSDSAIPGLENAEKQGRGFFALAALGGGVASAGLLAGLGAILRLMVADRLAKLGPEPDPAEPDAPPLPPIEPRERRQPEKKPRERAERKPRKPAEKKKPRERAERKQRKPAEKKKQPERDEE